MKPTKVLKNRWKKALFLWVLSWILTVSWIAPVWGQISLLAPSSDNKNSTLWWDRHKAESCGKYWCSNAYLNTREFTYLTLANLSSSEKETTEVALDLKERSRLVEVTLSQIFTSIVNSPKIKQLKPPNNLEHLLSVKKQLHPATPKIKVGIENKQTVVYIPPQPELGAIQQTIVTVNQNDARANNKSVEDLAISWRDLIEKHLSEKLWGYELDTHHPWFRISSAATLATITLIIILTIAFSAKIIKRLERKIQRKLKQLRESSIVKNESESLAAKPINSSHSQTESEPEYPASAANSPVNYLTPKAANFTGETITFERQNTSNPLNILNFRQKIIIIRQILFTQSKNIRNIVPKTAALLQFFLTQIRNILQLLIRLLFWSKIFILLIGITFIASLFPSTRFYCHLFFIQAIFLPLTWMLVGIVDKIAHILIDYLLDSWSKEAQLNAPVSNRYALRANTYSDALKQASSIIFLAFGICLTILLLGVDPTFLAGAGAIAVFLAIASRNIIENVLNGILILSADRYAVGDTISVNGIAGCVENINLYATSLRNLDGQLIVIPNIEIGTIINMTKDWSRVNFTIKLACNTDFDRAKAILLQIARQMSDEAEWGEKILESPTVLGMDDFSHEGILIRMLINTVAGEQWAVAREFRARVQKDFIQAEISLGFPQLAISKS